MICYGRTLAGMAAQWANDEDMGHGFAVSSVVFAPDGQTLFSGSWDATIKKWDLAYGREIQVMTGHSESVRALSLAADGNSLASSSWDGTVRIWDVATGETRAVLRGQNEKVHAVAFCNAGRAVSPSRNGASPAMPAAAVAAKPARV